MNSIRVRSEAFSATFIWPEQYRACLNYFGDSLFTPLCLTFLFYYISSSSSQDYYLFLVEHEGVQSFEARLCELLLIVFLVVNY